MAASVLVIDDEDVFREDLAGLLRNRGVECQTAANAEEGLDIARSSEPDVVLCDVKMPGMSGIEVLDELTRTCPFCHVIMMTAFADLDTAVSAFRKGAYDYVVKPVVFDDVWVKLERLSEQIQLARELRFLRRQFSQDAERLPIVGQSLAMKRIFQLIDDVAPTRSTVLLTGESGTGKEVVARTIHERSGRQDHPFVPINCAGIPEHLLESELFGHVKGAFTGAIRDHIGHLELARQGTVLLDEIGEMPMSLQSKLLRVLEQKEFVPVGGTTPKPLKARVIASTNRDLRTAVKRGDFREDLFFRVAVFEICLPPLRDRRTDIPALVEHFVAKLNAELKRQCNGVSREAMKCLLAHSWPGNIRELRNVLERAMIVNREPFIREMDLPEQLWGMTGISPPADGLRAAVQAYEREFILNVIKECGGNKEEAARRLDINPSTLYRKLAESALPLPAVAAQASE